MERRIPDASEHNAGCRISDRDECQTVNRHQSHGATLNLPRRRQRPKSTVASESLRRESVRSCLGSDPKNHPAPSPRKQPLSLLHHPR